MHKKILAICAALVALAALAVPAAASAAVTLREAGTSVPTGTKIVAVGDEESIFVAGELTVTCTNNQMTGTVATNNGTTVEGTIESAFFKGTQSGERCSSGFLGATEVKIPALTNEVGGTGHWCVKNIAGEDKFELIGAGCGIGTGTLTFKLIGVLGTCIYTRSASVTGTFTTTTGANPTTLTVTGEPKFTKEAESSSICPSEGKITKMKFTLATDNEARTPLQLDDVS